jgi:hypothetical protein
MPEGFTFPATALRADKNVEISTCDTICSRPNIRGLLPETRPDDRTPAHDRRWRVDCFRRGKAKGRWTRAAKLCWGGSDGIGTCGERSERYAVYLGIRRDRDIGRIRQSESCSE